MAADETCSERSPVGGTLRVAVRAPPRLCPWARLVLRQIEEAEFAHVAAVEIAEEAGRQRAPLGYRLYEWLDRRLFRSGADALAPAAQSNGIAAGQAADGALAERLRAASADVVLDLAGGGDIERLAPVSRYGVWSLHHGDSRRYAGGPPFFWEAHTGDPVSATELHATYVDGGSVRRRVLCRSFAATDGISLQRSRNAAYWKAAHLPARRLRDLHSSGWDGVLAEALPDEPPEHDGPVGGGPSGATMLRHVLRVGYRFARYQLATRIYKGQWFIALRERSGGPPPLDPSGGPLRPIYPPADRFFADPFLLEHEGVRCVFFEDYPLRTGKGLISCIRVGSAGGVSAPEVVLERDCHLSYPFVFEWEGEAYMIPETGGARTIELYRARRFPDDWVQERVLMRNIVAFDSTLLVHEGRFWLFSVVPVEGGTPWDELSVFWSESLFGPWRSHPKNPVVSDVRRARPAGRIFELDGALIRPGQDCTGRYGRAMSLNRIELLTTSEYVERPVDRLEPPTEIGAGASHCYDQDDRFEVVDGCRRVGRGRWGHLLPGADRGADGH